MDFASRSPLHEVAIAGRAPRWRRVLPALLVVFAVLALLPGRTAIPPLVQSDYVYLLIAADRLHDGYGLTSLQPLAPHQPWEWRYDWGHLSQWPMGYPLLVASVRTALSCGTIDAGRWISVFACAAALVGWFTWVRCCVPKRVTGLLLSTAAAGVAVSTAGLVNPSTDVLLTAGIPYVLLLTMRSVELLRAEDDDAGRRRGLPLLVLAGLFAGGLFWIRYASIFVPMAITLYLLLDVRSDARGSSIRLKHVGLFATAAAAPIFALVVLNQVLSGAGSVQEQLNLGHRMELSWQFSRLGEMWGRLTDLGYYDYRVESAWLISLWPVVPLVAAVLYRPARRALVSFAKTPGVALSGLLVLCLLVMLLTSTTLFSDKYDYIGQDRYYQPVRPLYFLLFVAPVMLVPRRLVRAILCVGLLIACSWTLQQEWPRPYKRWLAANREVTPYGQWAYCLAPGAGTLYRWLGEQDRSNLIVISNFHDYIALETGLPALPIPPDKQALDRWLVNICRARGVSRPRVRFVLDPDNGWRDYFLPDPEEVVSTFNLHPDTTAPAGMAPGVFAYQSSGTLAATVVDGPSGGQRIQNGG